MSEHDSGTSADSTGMHDTHLYDGERHDNQIVAVYADRAAAHAARDALVGAGVAADSVQVVDKPEADAPGGAEPAAPSVGDQVLSVFMGLFTSHDDHADYGHALDRGHAMVVVTPGPGADRHGIVRLLEGTSPIDFDAALAEWRQSGFDKLEKEDGDRRAGTREAGMSSERVRSYLLERP